MFLESESPFTSKFKLEKEFTNKYEYYMQGKVDDIQTELQLMRDRLDKYMSKFPQKFSDKPPMSRLGQSKCSLNAFDSEKSPLPGFDSAR